MIRLLMAYLNFSRDGPMGAAYQCQCNLPPTVPLLPA